MSALAALGMLVGGMVVNGLLVSYMVGKYRKTIDNLELAQRATERIFVDKTAEQNRIIDQMRAEHNGIVDKLRAEYMKVIDDCRERLDEAVRQVAYLEGKINGRKQGGY